jgi:hypothetical protein
MRIGLYFFSSLILTGLIGAYIHSLHLGTYTQRIAGIVFELPIATWFVLPMLVLLFFTLIHMMFYSMKNYFGIKKWKKDALTLQEALYWSILKEPKELKYLKKEIKSSAILLRKTTIDVSASMEGISEKVADAIMLVKDINRGEYIDLKERGLEKKISKQNPIFVQNSINRLDVDPKFVEEVLLSSESYSRATVQKALSLFAKKETFFKAKKFVKLYDIENLFVMVKRATDGEDIGMNEDMLLFFIDELNFSCVEYMRLARIVTRKFPPDQNLIFFRTLQKKDENASNAYLYLLFEYEMLDAIEEYLDENAEHEFIRYRALYTLKRNDSKYKMDSLINSDAVCHEH